MKDKQVLLYILSMTLGMPIQQLLKTNAGSYWIQIAKSTDLLNCEVNKHTYCIIII